MTELVDTIAAVSTPPGEGGIGIIRISGPDAVLISDGVFLANSKKPLSECGGYSMRLGKVVVGGEAVDDAIALLFRAPKSCTGEDVVELQCHGSPVVLERTLRALTGAGARIASAGEFSRRALLNRRISLTEAEGIANIISSVSKQGEAAAYALSKGSLFRETERIKGEILAVQSAIAAWIDFPEEDVEPIDNVCLTGQLKELSRSLKLLVDSYETGLFALRGVPTAIVGSPNVGKSTLMNLMAGYEKAIVTPYAGTTRDVLEHQIAFGKTTLILADTAGIRASGDDIERIGIERAIERMEQSPLLLAVFDGSRKLSGDDRDLIKRLLNRRVVAVINKADLKSRIEADEIKAAFETVIFMSAHDRRSLLTLEAAVAKAVGTDSLSPEAPVLMNERQRFAALKTLEAVDDALLAAKSGMTPDVVFILLDEALAAVMELSGENVSDAVLDEVFGRFCVGK